MPEENKQEKDRGFQQKQKKISPKPKPKRTVPTRNKTVSNPSKSLKSKNQKNIGIKDHMIEASTSFIRGLKGKRQIVGLTAYDSIMGAALSRAKVDFILVGDSVGTTLLGHETTIGVTMEDMIRHTAAVRRAQPECLLVSDLPFGEASLSFDRLLESARRLMQEGGADAIKIEGGADVADDIEKLVATGVPVLGHIGLLPQTVKTIGGYRKYGETREEAESIYTDAISLEEAGCFAIVAEMLDEDVTAELSKQILPPLIGIGSGKFCDGQILVTTDLLGWSNGSVPSFVRPYANLNEIVDNALRKYVLDIKNNK